MKNYYVKTLLLAIVSLVIAVFVLFSCGKKNLVIDDSGNPGGNPGGGGGTKITLPVLGAVNIVTFTNVSAKITVPITSNGGAAITEAGITIYDIKIKSPEAVSSEINFSLERLTPNSAYKIKGYAVNSAGTAYSAEVLLKTLNILVGHNGVKDIDGNQYDTVRIGNQTWMAENLKTKHYRDGSVIPNISTGSAGIYWNNVKTGAMCYYNNDTALYRVYGGLYNQLAVLDAKGLAPVGWHVPSISEWEELSDYLGGKYLAGQQLKEAGTDHWLAPNDGTNSTGFTALGNGARSGGGDFGAIKWYGYWWSTTYQGFACCANQYTVFGTKQLLAGNFGLSIRCLKDQ